MKKVIFLFLVGFISIQFAQAQTTKIYVVRHGEKSVENPSDRDPSLSADGKQRAIDLLALLKKEKIDAIFSTDYKRTRETVGPLAEASKITVQTYNPSDSKALAENIKTNFAGKTVVIVGHSNTVLEMTEALGAERPFKLLTDDDYDNLFVVSLEKGVSKATAVKFGKPHHAN